MRLLLDEMYPPAIAEQLRERNHDVHAVTERAELRGLADADIFAIAQQQERSVVTENIADFSLLADEQDHRGQAHHGLVFVSPAGYPRGRNQTIGRMVSGLERLMGEHADPGPTSLRLWL